MNNVESPATSEVSSEAEAILREIETYLRSDSDSPSASDTDSLIEQECRLSKIMMVDDEPLNIRVARKYLEKAGYLNFFETSDSQVALSLIAKERPALVLLDIMMPHISGLEILEQMKRPHSDLRDIQVVILTALDKEELKTKALDLGAIDFLTKPVKSSELVARVRNILSLKAYYDQLKEHTNTLESKVQERTSELEESRIEVIHCLGRAAEYRDNETGRHVVRVGKYSGIIARELNLDPEHAELIEMAAPLHDVGKIGIPDEILLKPGKLTPEEYEMMQKHAGFGKKIFESVSSDESSALVRHTAVGARMLLGSRSPIMRLAATIALTHHEKWDGSGYPLGLAGEDIPIEGRIVAVADVFDALSSKRPYKEPFPLAKCFSILEEERGKHFEPRIVDAFLRHRPEILEIQISHAEVD